MPNPNERAELTKEQKEMMDNFLKDIPTIKLEDQFEQMKKRLTGNIK